MLTPLGIIALLIAFGLYCGFVWLMAQCMGINRLKYQAMQRAEAVREERRLRLVGRVEDSRP